VNRQVSENDSVAEDNSVDRLVQAGKPAFSKIERAKDACGNVWITCNRCSM